MVIIFAGAAGYLDPIEPENIARYEHDLMIALDREEKILTTIRTSKDFSDETKKSLSEFLDEFGKIFNEKK